MDGYEYQLTPRSGERLAVADAAAQDANLLGLVVGHNVMETSFGRNAALRLALSGLRRFTRLEFGDVALSAVPVVNGMKVTVPANAALHLRGDTLRLRGSDPDGGQTFDFQGLESGAYALVLESWVSLVGATTLGQATLPDIYAGVIDALHKPDATHFYAAGNKDGGLVPDAAFADTTIQTTKALQRQYRLSVIPDRDLAGWGGVELPAGNSYASAGPHLAVCVLPQDVGAWDKAVDRTFTACKLAVVSLRDSALTVHTSDFRVTDSYTHTGQRPAPLRLTREQLEAWLRQQVQAVLTSLTGVASRLAVVESARQAATLLADEDQIVMPVASNGSVIPQRLRFTKELWDTEAWHDATGYPTRIRLPFNGVVQVNATATFISSAAEGLRALRLLQNGLPTSFAHVAPGDPNFDTAITLSAELAVKPGDYLEIEPWQASGQTLTIRQGALFSVRRVL